MYHIILSDEKFYDSNSFNKSDKKVTKDALATITAISELFSIPKEYFKIINKDDSDTIARFIILEVPAFIIKNKLRSDKLIYAFNANGYFSKTINPIFYPKEHIYKLQFEPYC